MSTRTTGLPDALGDYVRAQVSPQDPLLAELAADTAARFPDEVNLQIAPEQGALLTVLTRLAGAHRAVEVGTFTGYSSVCIARGLAPGGQLVCIDASREWTDVARGWWTRADVAGRIELRVGDAHQLVPALEDTPVDLAFVDADKEGYPLYYTALLERLAPDGVMAFDNTLAHGDVLAPEADSMAAAIARFNDLLREDDRVDVVQVPIGDGLTLVMHRRT